MNENDELYQLFEQSKQKHAQAVVEFHSDDGYIEGNYADKIIPSDWEDDALKPTVPPTVYDAVENIADHVLTTPKIYVPVRRVEGDTENQNEIAEKRRQFHEMWWHHVRLQGDPLRKVVKSLAKGKGVIKVEVDWALMEKVLARAPKDSGGYRKMLAKATAGRFPWKVSFIPRDTVYEDHVRPQDPLYLFETYQITRKEAQRLYGEQLGTEFNMSDAFGKVEFVEYWEKPEGSSKGKLVRWIDRVRVHDEDNPYCWETDLHTEDMPDYDGYLPYAIEDPGWGEENSESDPEARYVSVVRPIRSIAEAEARILTEMESWFRAGYVWPILLSKNMPELTSGDKEVALGPGAHIDLSENQELSTLQTPSLPPAVFEGLSRVNAYADRSTRFSVLSGAPQRGVDTATEADQNLRSASSRLSGIIGALQRMCMKINQWTLQDVVYIFEAPVTMNGAIASGPSEVTLTPTEIGHFFYTSVEFETTDEAALNARNLRTWLDAAQRAPISFRTALRMAGIQNPTGEMDERMVEELERSPQAQQTLMLMMLAGLGETGQTVKQAFEASLMGESGMNQIAPTTGEQPPSLEGPSLAQAEAVQNQPERSFF